MTVVRPGKGDKPTISKGKRGYRVTPKKSKAERERDKLLKIPKKLLKIPDPFNK